MEPGSIYWRRVQCGWGHGRNLQAEYDEADEDEEVVALEFLHIVHDSLTNLGDGLGNLTKETRSHDQNVARGSKTKGDKAF